MTCYRLLRSYGVPGVLLVVAHLFDHLGIRHQPQRDRHHPRLGVRLGIVDGPEIPSAIGSLRSFALAHFSEKRSRELVVR